MKEIGNILKEKRLSNGLSIEEACEDLDLDQSVIDNIESGNKRAFQNMYDLKEIIKDYAKYLGCDVNELMEEFNDFLFEHTSKISLDDIQNSVKEIEQPEKKVQSPYTKIPDPPKDYRYILIIVVAFLLVTIITILLVVFLKKEPKQVKELETYKYEFTNEINYI